jgi:4'-phosphopantetheinyl transferase
MTDVRWLACGEGEPPPHDDWLSERDRTRLATMTYTKRYEEARLSRWTAQRAVALAGGLGDSPTAVGMVSVTNATDGSPRAEIPGGPPLSISSTDRAGWAVSVVRGGAHGLGCDLELVEARSDAFIRDYFTSREVDFVCRSTLPVEVTANLLWSAKESALKVLRTGLRRDTRSVEVSVELVDAGWGRLEVDPADGRIFPGWWRRYGDFLLTVVSDSFFEAPSSLVEPTPLATAVPTHSWMKRPTRDR